MSEFEILGHVRVRYLAVYITMLVFKKQNEKCY